jgi:hypothetical protein
MCAINIWHAKAWSVCKGYASMCVSVVYTELQREKEEDRLLSEQLVRERGIYNIA